MRRLLILVTVAATMLLIFAAPTLAQTTTRFNAMFTEEFEGASPFTPCPTGGDPCGVGRITGFGKATERFVFVSGEEVDSCFHITEAITTITLQDGSGTLVISEEDTICTPGTSTDAPGNVLYAFGNPFNAVGTWTVLSGTGVFEGATGGGTLTNKSGGDVLVISYVGTVTLP